MTSKDNVAIHQLFSLLESRFAIRVLWGLKNGQAQTFRALQESIGSITPNTLNTRLKELRAATLVTHGDTGYVLTSQGLDLVKRLNDLGGFANKWAITQARRK